MEAKGRKAALEGLRKWRRKDFPDRANRDWLRGRYGLTAKEADETLEEYRDEAARKDSHAL